MPYGTISPEVKNFVEMRARQGNVFGRFELEPQTCEFPDDCEKAENCICFVPGLSRISIIVEGALDEEFEIRGGGFEVNIADWISEFMFCENVGNYWIMVSDSEGNLTYSVEG